MAGLPPDGAGSSAPLASATVALIKRTICLPLNQTQIPFPSNVPEASRDLGGPSRLHLLSQGPGSASPPPSIISPLQLGGGRAGGGRGSVTGDLIASWALPTRPPGGACLPKTLGSTCRGLKSSRQVVTAQDTKSR